MRLADHLAISLRDVRRQPVRSGLTVVSLIISSSLFVALVSLGLGTRAAIIHQLGQDTAASSILVTSSRTVSSGTFGGTVQVATGASTKVDDATVTRLSRLAGVRSATPVAVVYEFKEFTVQGYDRTFVAKTNAIEPGATGLFALAAGHPLNVGAGPEVVLGSSYAQALGVSADPASLVGRTVRIRTQNGYRGQGAAVPDWDATEGQKDAFRRQPTYLDARVVGVTDSQRMSNMVYIALPWAHGVQSAHYGTRSGTTAVDALARNGYSSVVVQVEDAADTRRVTAAIEALGYGASSQQEQIDQLDQLSTVMWIVLGSISLISLVSACLGIVNTMMMTVSEQRSAIGVWRACGATRSLISRLFLIQAAVLGLVGGVVGTGAGLEVSRYVNQKIAHLLRDQGLSALTIPPASTTTLVASVALTTLLSVLAGLYPAHRAAHDIHV